MTHLQGAVTKLANRLQRRLMAQQNRAWDFDQEKASRRPRLARASSCRRAIHSSYKIERDIDFAIPSSRCSTIVGRCAAADQHCGDQRRHSGPHARTLRREDRDPGLHDATWKGGQSRGTWTGSPRDAHRTLAVLNDLRHIIYKPADEPYRRARKSLGLMMREGLLEAEYRRRSADVGAHPHRQSP